MEKETHIQVSPNIYQAPEDFEANIKSDGDRDNKLTDVTEVDSYTY